MSISEVVDVKRKIFEFQKGVHKHLEIMAAAYLKKTDIPIEECELIVETLPDKIVYRFQRRITPQKER